MEEKNKQQRSFINEQIVPRKKYKKILVIVAAVIGLGSLFGSMAGVSFFISRSVVGKTDVSAAVETIVIARDDTTEAPGKTTAAVTTEAPADETTLPETAEESCTENTSEPEIPSAQEIYDSRADAFVTIHVVETGGRDWFDASTTRTSETFGVLIACSEESCYVLTDGGRLGRNASISVTIGGKQTPAAIFGYDSLNKLCVLKIPREAIPGEPETIPFGNSFALALGDPVIMAGAQYGYAGACSAGTITFIHDYVDVTDGYEQYLYTDLLRSAGGSAVLLNMEGEIVGWVSDYTCIDDSPMVIACGISPLKYLIEDICSGKDTAYLGVDCVTVTAAEAEAAGVPAGLYVQQVLSYSAAEEYGIKPGDRITSINGRSVTDSHTLQVRIDEIQSGQNVIVEIERRAVEGYEPMALEIRFGSR